MKILAINASPRKGNTVFILDSILKGKDAEIINLKDMNINFCGGGDNCCTVRKECHIKDDMPLINEKLEKADLVMLASPCYFSNVTARMKNFMDRCNPCFFNKKLKGKRFFLIAVGGYPVSLKEAIHVMKNFLKGIHAEFAGSYTAVADKVGALRQNQKVIKELETLSETLENG
jgi:multimeric flavodoxin WrbA